MNPTIKYRLAAATIGDKVVTGILEAHENGDIERLYYTAQGSSKKNLLICTYAEELFQRLGYIEDSKSSRMLGDLVSETHIKKFDRIEKLKRDHQLNEGL